MLKIATQVITYTLSSVLVYINVPEFHCNAIWGCHVWRYLENTPIWRDVFFFWPSKRVRDERRHDGPENLVIPLKRKTSRCERKVSKEHAYGPGKWNFSRLILLLVFCSLCLNSSTSDETNSWMVKILQLHYIGWLEDAKANLGNQREMKLSPVSLKENTTPGERSSQESRWAGLAHCELVLWDHSHDPSSTSLRCSGKITLLPTMPSCLGRVGGEVLHNL